MLGASRTLQRALSRKLPRCVRSSSQAQSLQAPPLLQSCLPLRARHEREPCGFDAARLQCILSRQEAVRLTVVTGCTSASRRSLGGGNLQARWLVTTRRHLPTVTAGHRSFSDVSQYASKGRKVVVKLVGRVRDTASGYAKSCRALTVAFVNNPLIVREWYADIREAVVHFSSWIITGFKLFGADVRASFVLIKRVVQGYPLSVRERHLLVRTTSDCLKLIPFSFFIIVPFAELALPFFLRLFPTMLPSTFFEQKYDNATLARKLQAKQELGHFFQQVVEQRTKEISNSSKYSDKAAELQEFQGKLLEGKEFPSLKEILRFSALFQDEFGLKKMSPQQLRTMSQMLGLPQSTWWTGHLEVQLRHHITNLRREDRDLLWEGIDGLSGLELIEACRKRGIRFHEVTEAQMRTDLNRWLGLSANHKEIPTSLLLWIQSFYLRPYESATKEALQIHLEEPEAPAEEAPGQAFHGIADRQKASLEAARERLEQRRHEIDEVLQQEPGNQGKEHTEAKEAEGTEAPRSEEEEKRKENQKEAKKDFVEKLSADEEKRLMRQQLQESKETIKLYKEIVDKQKLLLEEQLGFLGGMWNNKPTHLKDANVIMLDQRVRLVEMMGSFNEKMSDIEKLLQDVDAQTSPKQSAQGAWDDLDVSHQIGAHLDKGSGVEKKAELPTAS